METQQTLESRILDAPKRRGPLEGPIKQMATDIARLADEVEFLKAVLSGIRKDIAAQKVEPKPGWRFWS